MSDIFKYNTGMSYEANYSTWKLMNDREYMEAGAKPYSKKESRRVFNENHGNYLEIDAPNVKAPLKLSQKQKKR